MLAKRVIQQTPDFLALAIFRREGRYVLRLADTEADLDAVQKLRYDVFNVELGEGLPSSAITRRDQDEFDSVCHHLMIIDDEKNEVVGTYRIQTGEMAAAGNGFYSAGEFDLSLLPDEIPHNSVELRRACIAAEHRHTQALLLLWKGIAAYLKATGKRYLFGCCSLSSQSMTEARAVMKLLEAGAHIHPFLYVRPRPGFACDLSDEKETSGETAIPKLFKTYLRVGAKVCGAPAIDRQFGTIDFFCADGHPQSGCFFATIVAGAQSQMNILTAICRTIAFVAITSGLYFACQMRESARSRLWHLDERLIQCR